MRDRVERKTFDASPGSKEKRFTEAKNMDENIRENVKEVLSRIEGAAARAGRSPGEVDLLAATKNRSPEEVDAAVSCGVKIAGENRVQELLEKIPRVLQPVKWHFIGHLQRNKVKQVVGSVELVHSLDSVRLASEIDERARQCGIIQSVLLQVNVAGEEAKSGFEPGELRGALEESDRLRNVRIRGLSTIAPMAEDPEEVRWVFRRLAELGSELGGEDGGFVCEVLSMGMTNDYEVAVEEGSTCVRVGTALFGPRAKTG